MTLDDIDRNRLIRDAYRIEGIGQAECRSIFLDWALGLPAEFAPRDAIASLLVAYGADHPDHPMGPILRAGLGKTARPERRGGRRARVADDPG